MIRECLSWLAVGLIGAAPVVCVALLIIYA